MTSSTPGTFVFVRLPKTNEVVVAGRFDLTLSPDGNVGYFRYGRSYLAREDCMALDPIHLPLREEVFRTSLNGGMFGVLRDSAPDFWGRVVIERTRQPEHELDYLLATSDLRVGSLGFNPTSEPPRVDYSSALPLERLEQAAASASTLEDLLAGEGDPTLLDPRLLDSSSGVGGARPKTVTIDDQGQLWLAKFPSRGDRWANAIAEGTYLRLARQCGIETPEIRVLDLQERCILLVQRFDQDPSGVRRPFLSAHTLLGLDEGVTVRTGWSYIDLVHLIRRISADPETDARELYRRVVFNSLTSNLDDHPRNHAVIWRGGGWRLSPAYDLTPALTRSIERRDLAMAISDLPGSERWANRANLLSSARHFGLSQEEVNTIISEMRATISANWRETLRELGGQDVIANQIAFAFPENYPGFEYPLSPEEDLSFGQVQPVSRPKRHAPRL